MSLALKNPQKPKQRSSLRRVVIGVALVLVALVIVWGVQQSSSPDSPQDLQEQFEQNIGQLNQTVGQQLSALPQALAEELNASRIYFILSLKGTRQPQSFAFENGAFSAPEGAEDMEDGYYSYSADGESLVFFSRSLEGGDGAQLNYGTREDVIGTPFPALTTVEAIDQSPIHDKRLPAVSDSGRVLFTGWDRATVPSVENSDDWGIYHVGDNGTEFLLNGFMPKWRNDEQFYFISNAGIQLMSYETSERVLVATSSSEVVFSSNRIDVSDDGNYLAWMQPELSTVVLYTINPDGMLSEYHSFPMRGFWVAFSPSSTYLALQSIAIDAFGDEEFPEAKVEFFDIAAKEKVQGFAIDLDAFDQLRMFMTEWTRK